MGSDDKRICAMILIGLATMLAVAVSLALYNYHDRDMLRIAMEREALGLEPLDTQETDE